MCVLPVCFAEGLPGNLYSLSDICGKNLYWSENVPEKHFGLSYRQCPHPSVYQAGQRSDLGEWGNSAGNITLINKTLETLSIIQSTKL